MIFTPRILGEAAKDQISWVGQSSVAFAMPTAEAAEPGTGADADRAAVLGLFDGALARYKHPRDVVFMDALPRNAMGKILKYELRETVAR